MMRRIGLRIMPVYITMFEPTQIRADLRRAGELMQQAEMVRSTAIANFEAEMQKANTLMLEAAKIQSACVGSSLQRVEFLDVENRGLNDKLGSAERERDALRIEASQLKQLTSG